MPRLARTVLVGLPHHITHRGNRSSTLFFSRSDQQRYVGVLLEASRQHDLDLWAYCLMSNHVHFLAVPHRPDSLARAVGYTDMMHARHVNSRHGWTGHLWANRFYSSPVEPERAEVVARYIELNPVRAGMVDRPEEHFWSSARAHSLGAYDALLANDCPIAKRCDAWRQWLSEGTEESEAQAIRRATATGSPIGSAAFLERLEETLGRHLRRRDYRSARHGVPTESTYDTS